LGLFLGETHEPEVVDARPGLFLSRWYCLGNGGMHVAPDRIRDRLTDDLTAEDDVDHGEVFWVKAQLDGPTDGRSSW